MIRKDAIWLVVLPVDMSAGSDTLLAQVVAMFGAAQPHHAYCFATRRTTRLKVVVDEGIGIWLAARRLHRGGFVWPTPGFRTAQLTRVQLNALTLGLPWQRLAEPITML